MKIAILLTCILQFTTIDSSVIKKYDLHTRQTRSAETQIGCISMKTLPGEYTHISDGTTKSCALYLIGSTNQNIEIEFTEFNIECEESGLLSLVDGWEMNGEFFPAPSDHSDSMHDRYKTFCGENRPSRRYVASQNVALVQFRIPRSGHGFRVSIRFIPNPRPCNVVSMFRRGDYMLTNFGQRKNCSVSFIYSERITIIEASIGLYPTSRALVQSPAAAPMGMGLSTSCSNSAGGDYVEYRQGHGLDPARMRRRVAFCGEHLNAGVDDGLFMGCQHTVVRMVSSGDYDNYINFEFSEPSPEEEQRFNLNNC